MEWLAVSALAFFIGTMAWVVYDISFRQFPPKKKHKEGQEKIQSSNE